VAKSRYENFVVRRPAIVQKVGDKYIDVMPKTDKIPDTTPEYTGPRVIISKKAIPDCNTVVEYCFVTGDTTIGNGSDFDPHKHNYEEIFIFMGTNPEDTTDLGAEIEFYLGEGKDIEKLVFTKSASVYVPPGVAHFPQIWKNVTRPVLTMVIMPTSGEKEVIAVPLAGRVK
jgi:hypothetical protein